jgi:hypothetical protein
MSSKKPPRNKPFHLDISFREAVGRFAHTDPKEIAQNKMLHGRDAKSSPARATSKKKK